MTWVFVDEHPDSINDELFGMHMPAATSWPKAASWVDVPASYHNGACGFSFADGHSEVHRWRDPRTTPPLMPGGLYPDHFVTPNNADVAWLQERSTRPKK